MSQNDKKVGFIGAGVMAEALISSIIKSGVVSAEQIWVSNKNSNRGQALQSKYGVHFTRDNKQIASTCDVVVYAVKPYILSQVLTEVSDSVSPKTVHVSIAAGISIQAIQANLPENSHIVRVMPNTPCMVGEGASAYSLGENFPSDKEQFVKQILDSTGKAVKVDEKLLNAVTGISGSGPAYVFLIIEALADAGVKAGLPRDVSITLAAQTLLGSAKMVLETEEHPAKLKDMVTTPGGTTIAALHVLEQGNIRATLIDGVLAAVSRAEEMGQGKK